MKQQPTQSNELVANSLVEAVSIRKEMVRFNPESLFPWRRPCAVKALIVTDGSLDFGLGDFGLSTFVHALQTGRSYVRFDITLAHLRNDVSNNLEINPFSPGNTTLATAENLLINRARITRHLKDFCFDRLTDFTPEMYDEVWLFGFETYYHQPQYQTRNVTANNYPATTLKNTELIALSAHMERGGGLFATGDHGSLGKALCGDVKRIRNMRYWESHIVAGEDEVGMSNARRNDTNQPGHDASFFSDQSDDVPQPLNLKLYSSRSSLLRRARYPHPIMCSSMGRIDVFPDHPHEGECIVPADPTLNYALDGTAEFPVNGGGTRIIPEIIATSNVLAGTTSTSKMATVAHSFGAICAYDGHLAEKGRVVTDSTWHHFVNVNLIGIVEGGGFDEFVLGIDNTKHTGFLATPAGRAALAKIMNYYVNIGVWMAPTGRHTCFHNNVWWRLVYHDRILEATLLHPELTFDRIRIEDLYSIGVHARDVIGNSASQCQTIEWIIDWLRPIAPELVRHINPWASLEFKKGEELNLPLFDPMPLIDVAIGGAIVAMRKLMSQPPAKYTDADNKRLMEAGRKGSLEGLNRAIENMKYSMEPFETAIKSIKRSPKQ
jgi:hypothetical protein